MGIYILKRLLLFIPTLIAISLLAFVISINAPGDPIDRLLNVADAEGNIGQNAAVAERLKQQKRHEMGLDLPVFYVSLSTLADIDTLHKIPDREQQQTIQRLINQTGNATAVINYFRSVKKAVNTYSGFKLDAAYIEGEKNTYQSGRQALAEQLLESGFLLNTLLETPHLQEIENKLISLQNTFGSNKAFAPLAAEITNVQQNFTQLKQNRQRWKTFIPTIHFHGLKNQYHHWISKVLQGDFGISYRDQQPVIRRIKDRFWWSFTLTFLSVLLAYALSIPIGVYSAYKRNSFFDRGTATLLFMLYSLPSFFAGTMLLMLFANPEFFNWFPESGVQDPIIFDPNWSFLTKIQHWAPYLVLPFITYTYSSLAFISRQMRVGMLDVLTQDYIKTARAKGISERGIIWKHAFRNALMPIITVFASVFPLAISGSVVVETIFGIPGMGLEIYESIRNYDYPMIVAVFSIFGVLTLFGYLLADILYAVADPRISYSKK